MVLLIYMEHGDTMDFHHGDAPEQSVKDNAAFRLMSVIAERDAAILERNTALAEKKAAYAERDAALLQRDVAYADRNAALSERDAAIAALDQIRDGSMNDPGCLSCRTVSGTKLLQVLSENQNIQPVNVAFPSQALDIPTGQPQKQTKLAFKKKDRQKVSASKRKSDGSTPKTSMPLKPRTQAATLGEESKEQLTVIKHEQNDQTLGNSGIVFETLPIPVCYCTGVPHQCYRWGTGGWQSACCTTTISMYPLPMNPNKRGARMAGRKMSGGAFMKVLQRLSVEGHTLSCPIDLKNYWARHGTNRFVTIS